MNNFTIRTISGAVFLAVMVAGILFHPAAFGVLFLVVMYFAMREFMQVTMGDKWNVQQKLALVCSGIVFIAVMGGCFFGLRWRWAALAAVPFCAIPVTVIFAKRHDDVEYVALAYLAMIYAGLPFCLAPFIVRGDGGAFQGMLLLNVFVIIWCSDIGAYCIGTLLGQKPGSRKLAPAISPKKSSRPWISVRTT